YSQILAISKPTASDLENINENQLGEIEPGDVCGELDVIINQNEEVNGVNDILKSLVGKEPELIHQSPFEIFLNLLSEDYLEHLVNMTNLYTPQKLAQVNTTSNELIRFFGILLYSECHKLPEKDHYWSMADDLSNGVVPKIMSRKRFHELKTYLHLVDNLNLEPGKAAKVTPFYRHLSKRFQKIGGIFVENLSIDESIVPYFGHHSCKMFIRGKPIHFGYKLWMMCSSDGYPFALNIYMGTKNVEAASTVEEKLPVCTQVIFDLIAVTGDPTAHSLYFENFFTSYDLMIQLREHGFRPTG
uniref:PiggyBac transposable element-derived protein domain-containing protein n=1 Tax=Romanomermis culicivorax TaxID=13658 RepID=A0A915HUB4_ROMCU